MSRNLLVALALAVLSLAVAAPAHAALITVNFTVTGDASDPNPLNAGQTASGSFSFEKPVIPPAGLFLANATTGLDVSALSFTWDGHTWTTADADAWILSFNSSGALTQWSIAGTTGGFSSLNSLVFPDMSVAVQPGGISLFNYTTSNSPSVGILGSRGFSWSYTESGAVPEPGTLALFAPGLIALALARRRKS